MYTNPTYFFKLGSINPEIYDCLINKVVVHKTLGEGLILKINRKENKNGKTYLYFHIKFEKEMIFTEEVYKFLYEIKLTDKDKTILKEMEEKARIIRKTRNNEYNKTQKFNMYDESINLTKSKSEEIHYYNNFRKYNKSLEEIYYINDNERNKIKQFINSKNIYDLIHFTQLDNLESIMENGLLSVDSLIKNNIAFSNNDNNRFDNLKNTICLSTGFPNYKMFYKLRDKDELKKWVVLKIEPKVLYEKTCIFCRQNAASHDMNSAPISEKIGYKGLNEMFYENIDNVNRITRDTLNIKSYHTTNPQAEVLVFDKIEDKYIKGIVFSREDSELAKKFSIEHKNIKVIVNNSYYSARYDYRYWGDNHGKEACVYSK